jgi:hypothetical protein
MNFTEATWFYPVHVSGWKYCGLKHHAVKMCGTWGIAPRILNLDTGWRSFSAAVPLIKVYGAYYRGADKSLARPGRK